MEQYWKIIPNITTPLAALCFITATIYVIIRVIVKSKNKIKAESLKVTDPKAQKKAAESILKEYPDLKISSIDDDKGKVELAKLIIQSQSSKYQIPIYAFVVLAVIFLVAYLIPILISDSHKNDTTTAEIEFLKTKSWAELNAIKAKYPYATFSVIQHIKLRDVVINGEEKRFAEFRNSYTILATRDINTSESVFNEEFTTNHRIIKPWAGSDFQQIESNLDSKFSVKFDLNKYKIKTIMTGVSYTYSFPLQNSNSTSCFGKIGDDPNEWMTCYPNETDYIDNLKIIIEAEGINIQLPPNSMYRKTIDGSIKNEDGHCKIFSSNPSCTLIASWDTLSPGECVAFKINW